MLFIIEMFLVGFFNLHSGNGCSIKILFSIQEFQLSMYYAELIAKSLFSHRTLHLRQSKSTVFIIFTDAFIIKTIVFPRGLDPNFETCNFTISLTMFNLNQEES